MVMKQDRENRTVLHYAAESGNSEAIVFLLNILPDSERLEAVCMRDCSGDSVLQLVKSSDTRSLVKASLPIEEGNRCTLL